MALVKRNHNPFAPQQDFLYMLLDITTVEGTNVLAVGTMRRVQLLGRLKAAEGKKVCAPPIEGRGFSKLSIEQLKYLWWNLTQTAPGDDYAQLIQDCMGKINEIVPNDEHVPSLEYLVNQLDPNEGRLADGTLVDPNAPKEVVRPKATTTTGIIWAICDEVMKELRNGEVPADAEGWKIVRAEAFKRCDAEGFNSGTFAVQYGKWKGKQLTPAG